MQGAYVHYSPQHPEASCYNNDYFCQLTGGSMKVHTSYKNATTVKNEVAFLKPFIVH
jgi:hypothetical protein